MTAVAALVIGPLALAATTSDAYGASGPSGRGLVGSEVNGGASPSAGTPGGGSAANDTTSSDPASNSAADGEDASQSAPASGGDALTQNGLGSVLCREPQLESQLSAAAQSNCDTSSFVAAAAPTGNYAFDIHIDTGPLSLGNTASAVFQDYVLTPAWTALLWVVHALMVALEWCYSLDLLDGATLGTVAGALRSLQATLTQPLMVLVLALASVLALYNGLVRRRVAETLGDFLLMVAMMAVGLWVILDPIGTVGALGHWADEASLGTVGAVLRGTPTGAEQSLGDGLREVYSSDIQEPWCFLEFGDVDWCENPARIDAPIRAAAVRIEAIDRADQTPADQNAAELLSRATTNGDFFLALPANQPQRNSINDTSSLLRVMCGSSDDSQCQGPTAAEAEFRTASGTWSRAGGLILIVIGAAGMIALLTFLALRLLGAAVASLLYLLLAPIAVLAPAIGDGGRAAFRNWGTRLLGALLTKLVYSIFLGVVLLLLRILESLNTLGFWTQWLLIACLWWTAFRERHRILEHVYVSGRDRAQRGMRATSTLLAVREISRLGQTVLRSGQNDDGRGGPPVQDPRPDPKDRKPDTGGHAEDAQPRDTPRDGQPGSDRRKPEGDAQSGARDDIRRYPAPAERKDAEPAPAQDPARPVPSDGSGSTTPITRSSPRTDALRGRGAEAPRDDTPRGDEAEGVGGARSAGEASSLATGSEGPSARRVKQRPAAGPRVREPERSARRAAPQEQAEDAASGRATPPEVSSASERPQPTSALHELPPGTPDVPWLTDSNWELPPPAYEGDSVVLRRERQFLRMQAEAERDREQRDE